MFPLLLSLLLLAPQALPAEQESAEPPVSQDELFLEALDKADKEFKRRGGGARPAPAPIVGPKSLCENRSCESRIMRLKEAR